MYHPRFRGTHEAIGYRWGQAVKKNGKAILDNIPFELTEERRKFSLSCLPAYQKHCPELLEEISGIAKGQGCANEDLLAVIFGMFTIMPMNCCSSFLVRSKNSTLLCRNSDFLTSIEKFYMNTIYHFDSDDFFSFTGNTTAFTEMEDGINQHGFCTALTSAAPYMIQPGINLGMLLRMMLERCRNVSDALQLAERVPICCSGTLMIGDAKGAGALLEVSPEKIEVRHISQNQPFLCAVNMFNTPAMKPFNRLPEDTWQAEERFHTLKSYLSEHASEMNVASAQELLAGKHGFLCQYDRTSGKDTVWSVVYDLTEKRIYRAEGNPGRKKFAEDKRFEIMS